MKFIFTCGDINGIGPEITVKAVHRILRKYKSKIVIAIPGNVFIQSLETIPQPFKFEIVDSFKKASDDQKTVSVLNLGKARQSIGKPTKTSGKYAYKAIESAYSILKDGYADAMITAPISKEALHLAGYNYPGHTELLAEWGKVNDFVMMFFSATFNTALMTIHEPVAKISKIINKSFLKKKFNTVHKTLVNDFGIKKPSIAVLGLNPHAGENGLIGKEERDIIKPVIDAQQGDFNGPFVPDAFFANKLYRKYDLVIGMYHDQVLIPFKLLSRDTGVNYTAGLPIIRTSPDHGTAFDIAGENKAKEKSMFEAFATAYKVAKNHYRAANAGT